MNETDFQQSIARQKATKSEAQKLTAFCSARSLTDPKARFPGFRQRKVDYHAGQQLSSGALVLPSDFVMHESVPMVLSDGVKLYCDIFLPPRFQDISTTTKHEEQIPALIAWSPYGKQMGTTLLEDFPLRAGVPKHWLSGLQKWEAPDPAWWCQHDYAIINVDTRGAFTSEGDLILHGHQEAEDGAEFTTWVSEQPWCSGKVAFTGNSWLAMMQWKIGSLRPKGLSALAPWEGMDDLYRESVCIGGVPSTGFNDSIQGDFVSQGKLEDMSQGVRNNPLWNSYWEDKRADTTRINVPVYAVGSYTNPIHVTGTLRAWKNIPDSVPKYLRINNSQEWSDYYEDANQRDLKRFFDHYLKNIENGWSATPKVRLSVLHFGMTSAPLDTVNRAEADWPLPRTKFTRLYLNSDNSLSLSPAHLTPGTVSYDSTSSKATFRYVIPHDVETTGYFMAHLCMSCASHTEMDVFVQVEKTVNNWRQGTMTIKPQGIVPRHLLGLAHDWQFGLSKVGMLFHWGPSGVLRASHALDREEGSTDEMPLYKHTRRVMLRKGEVRVLDVPIAPYGMFWEKGDVLQFTVAGKAVNPIPLPGVKRADTDNKGEHTIHCGSMDAESSYLLVPIA